MIIIESKWKKPATILKKYPDAILADVIGRMPLGSFFYRCFQNRDTLRHELTWSHYRRLISVEDENARLQILNHLQDAVKHVG